jgi:subtilisin family serine protease
MKRQNILARASLLIVLFAANTFAAERFLVRMDPSVADSVAKTHNLKLVKKVTTDGLYVVSGSSLDSLRANPLVQGAEKDIKVTLPELSAAYSKAGHKLPVTVRKSSGITMPGTPWQAYLNQSSNTLINLPQTHAQGRKGTGVTVAIIDTGVDYTHPVLASSIDARSWNFLMNSSDVQVNQETTPWVDQETTPWVDQETTPWVDGSGSVVLNQETTPWVDQETTPWVDQETTPWVDKLPPAYGHGTMVAGIVHLVAPEARIMALKAFNAYGEGTMSTVVQAIRYAVDNGADVINMSFSADTNSAALQDAINYATSRGVICVASVSNDGKNKEVYPSNVGATIGVGASDNNDAKASFSNWGSDVDIAAPGVGIYTTYPMGHYAAGWGTSFSTPYVAGTAALMKRVNSGELPGKADSDLKSSPVAINFPNNGHKATRLDVLAATNGAQQ